MKDLERLVHLSHSDPHALLGPHRVAGKTIVRAFRPDADTLNLITEPGPLVTEMSLVDARGIFEAHVTAPLEGPRYQLESSRAGHVQRYIDPYAFWPTLGDLDLHFFGEGRHWEIYEHLGAHIREHQDTTGVAFAVWAPNARGVSVVGDFNGWDGRLHQMRQLGSSGVWELFIPGLTEGLNYKFEIRPKTGSSLLRADPYAQRAEVPPKTASVITAEEIHFGDEAWMKERASRDVRREPISIYEVHIGSWRRVQDEGGRPLNYRELAVALGEYVRDLGFTHVELLPVMQHPYDGSWGYQMTGYYAPASAYGSPEELRFLIDHLHQCGIGVLLDWVPAHFPKDDFALARFDGSALYEHLDSRLGEHPDWGTLIFQFGRHEVRNFLLGSALYWLDRFHADGLRVDAVASMLYLDYSRKEGEWVPNRYGGRENLEAIDFLRTLSELCYGRHAGTMLVAEESTAWPGVSRPTYVGGLGFGFKWNMGWMHDSLTYFSKDPVHRKYHHNNLTFGFLYAWSENFILPLSHDEVVHGKGSLIDKMPGDRWQKFANLRALYGWMWAHPGKKLLFMGGEFGQWHEWSYDRSLDWHLVREADHRGVQLLVRDLNRLYRAEPALHQMDCEAEGFQWIAPDCADDNVAAFIRWGAAGARPIVCAANFSPVVRSNFRLGLPRPGIYRELLNTDSAIFGGSNVGNRGAVHAEEVPCHGFGCSASVTLPPLAVVWLGWEA